MGVVDLLGLQVALGLRRGGGELEASPYPALRDAGAERLPLNRVDGSAQEPSAWPAGPSATT